MGAIKSADYIPMGPLVDYIERNYGGVTRVPATGVWDREETDDRYGTAECVDRTPEEEARARRLGDMLKSARNCERTVLVNELVEDEHGELVPQARYETTAGWIGLHTADLICCDYLGVHPMAVWGVDWFEFGETLTAANERWVERWANGTEKRRNPAASKLDAEKVIDIRQRVGSGEPKASVAESHGVSLNTVHDIVKRRTWGWVPSDERSAA